MSHNVAGSPLLLLLIASILSPSLFAATLPDEAKLASQQVLVRQIKDEPASLDPAKAVGLPEISVIRDLFEGLTNQDSDGNIIPGVAESWQTEDNKTWIFTIRKQARWSDGQALTAHDFVYSWRRLVDPKTSSTYSWFASLAGIGNSEAIIKGDLPVTKLAVTAVDQNHLKIVLEKPLAWFPALTANFSLFPVPQQTIEKYQGQWTQSKHFVGNGAYLLANRVVNEKLMLTRNKQYWDNQHTVINQVTWVPIAEESVATQRYQAGDLDITESFPKNMYPTLKKSLPGEIITPAQLGLSYYAFNNRKGPTSDKRVRQALNLSIDRAVITQKVLGTGEKSAWTFTPPYTRGFHADPIPMQQLTQSERLKKAKNLMQGAGYNEAHPLKLSLLYNSSEMNKLVAIAITSMWSKNLGVKVSLQNQEWKSYIDTRNSGNFDIIRGSWVADYNEASSFLSLFTSWNKSNFSDYHNSSYDELLNRASIEPNEQSRNILYNQAEQILARDVPIMPIYYYVNARLIKPWVKGYPINNPEDFAYTRMLWIAKH